VSIDRNLLRQRLAEVQPQDLPLQQLRPAAVLLLLFRADNEDWVLLTRRTEELEHHAGEISFPGGGRHPEDPDLLATALRETEEEMGIRPKDVTVYGRLDDFISVYGFRVTPFVGEFTAPYKYAANPAEIAEIIELPLRQFLGEGVWHEEDWTYRGRVHPVDFYQVGSYQVWGMTAAILRHFFQRYGLLEG